MLPKENRLKLKRDFEKVFKQGKGYKQDCLFMKIVANGLGQVRFGFIVSKKISNKAVVRNKIKRQLREIIRNQLNQIKQGIDIVIVTLPGIENQEFQEIQKTIDVLFKKSKILIKNND